MKNKIIVPLLATSILLILLCMPGLIFYADQHSVINLLYALMVPLFIFLIPLIAFRKVIRWYAVLIGIFILIAPMATFPVIYFGDLVGKDMLVITFNTTHQEAAELIKGYLPVIIITYIAYILLGILAIKRLPKSLSLRKSALISATAVLLLIFISAVRYGPRPLIHHVKGMIYTYYPFHLFYAGYTFYKQEKLVENSEKYITDFPYKEVIPDLLRQRQVYIMLIGESSRYDHWEINGYGRATSPSLIGQQQLLDFKDVSACGCLTELSVPQILTGVTPDHYEEHFHQGGILQLFHQAGYKTYWISNQTDNGNIRMHANRADSMIWMQNTIATNKHLHYDMELVNSMEGILKSDTGNCLFVIHTIGSHYDYTARYPASFKKFRPVFSINLFRPTERSKKNQLINAYDNTILYTDAMIDSVIKVINHLHCISAVLYTSDHGENLFDDSRNLVLHAPIPPTRYIAHVPLFIYCSTDYIKAYPFKWKYLNEHVNGKISNNQCFETLVNMAGISYEGANLHNSLADSSFESSRQAILGPDSKIYYYNKLK